MELHTNAIVDLSSPNLGGGGCINRILFSSGVDTAYQRLLSLSSDIRTSISDDNSLSDNTNQLQIQPSSGKPNLASRENTEQVQSYENSRSGTVEESRKTDDVFSVSDWRAPGWEKKSLELAAAGVGKSQIK